MMAESKDPRAADLMLRVLQGYIERRTFPPGRALIGAGMRLGPRAFPLLLSFYQMAKEFDLRRVPLEGICRTQDPRALSVLLDEYGDQTTGIRDRTSEITDRKEKDRYFDLWHCSRILEPTSIKALQGEDQDLRKKALEVLDRESRYGKAADTGPVRASLEKAAGLWGERSAEGDRCREVSARFADWQAMKDRGIR